MNDLEAVKACRSCLESIRERQEELELLEHSRALVPEAGEEMSRIVSRCRREMEAQRQKFPALVSKATLILAGLGYRERRVMMLYYVSGCTLRETARALNCGVRTVQKLKKAGLENLARRRRECNE